MDGVLMYVCFDICITQSCENYYNKQLKYILAQSKQQIKYITDCALIVSAYSYS